MKIKIVIAVALFNLFAVCNFVVAQIPTYVPTNGLVGWWPFTGNANDISGNGNHGTVNGATLTTDRFGNANQAYLNNTSSGSISLNPSVLDNLGAFNVSIWFNASNTQSGVSDIFQIDANSPCGIYPAQTGNPNNNVYVRYDNGLAQFYFSIQINATVIQYTVPSPPSTNQWHLVSVNYSGTSVSFFLNGQLLNTQPLSGTFLTFNQPLFIANWCIYEDFSGKVDDIGIWNRALTQQEITNLYHANNGPQITISTANNSICAGQSATLTATVANAGTSCNTAGLPPSLNNGLVGYWPFCGNANDASGNGNNGIVNGATLTTDRFGAANQSYGFDGVNDNIRVNNNALFSFLLNSSFTSNVWFKIQTLPNGTKFLISQGDGDAQHQNRLWGSYLTQNSVNNWFRGNNEPNQVFNTHPSLQVNAWKMVTMVRDFNSTIKMYIDGQLVDTDVDIAGIASPFTQIRDIYFGALYDAYNAQLTAFLNGQLDDIGIWNRALSAQEVSQLYNAGQATYLWSNGTTTPSITVTPTQTTTYTCTITMNGASTTQSQTITVNPVPTVNAGQDQTVFAGTQVTLSGSGASSYAWNNGVINNTPFAATTTTTYTVTGTTNGCSATDQVLVTVLPAPSISATNDTICNGTSTTITATVANAGTSCAAPGLSGTLTNGLVGYWPFCGNANDLSGNGNNGTVNGATLTNDRFGLANSAYSFDGVNDFVQCTQSGISGNHSVTVSFWIKSGIGSGHVFSYGGNGSSGNDFRVLINSYGSCGNSIAFDIYNSGTGFTTTFGNFWDNYTIVYNSSLGNSVLSSSIYKNGTLLSNSCFTSNAVATNFLNNFPITFGRYHGTIPTDYLNGQLDDIGIWNRALNAAEIQALYTQGQATYLWSNGATTPSITISPTQTTTYTCTVTMNGATTTKSQTITVNALPNVSAGQNQTVCAGTSVTLSGSGASTYIWNNGVINGVSFTPNNTQTYTVTGTDVNGCANTAQTTVTVNALPMVGAGTNQTVCAGTQVTLNGSGASSYAWNNGVSNGVSFVPNNTQTYTVTGTTSGCVNTAQVTVSVNPLPTVNAGQAQTVCAGTAVTLSGSGASTYTWNNNIQNGVPFTPLSTQTYTVTGIAANGCQNTAQVTVTVNVPPTVSGGSTQTVCVGTPVTLNGSGASSYSWNNNVQNGVPFTPLSTQTYTVTGTAVNGCTNTAQVQVVVNVLPAVSGGQNQSVCAGASLVLNGAGALTYTWNNNIQNGVSFIPNTTQTYTVIGTNANGCQNSAQVQVTVNPLPTVGAGLPIAVCSGAYVVLNGSGAQTYAWSNGIQNAVPFVPGNTQVYTVTGTDANGCTDTDQILVTVNSYPQVNAGQNQTLCAGDSLTLTASGALSYTWGNGIVNGFSFVPASTTTYSVIGNSNGCLDTAQVTVTVNPLPTVSAGQAQTVCAGSSVTLNATGASNYLWDNNVQNSVAFIPDTTQTYMVTGTDINGCENTAQITVIINALPTVSGGQNQSVCAGATLVLNGAGALTYTWNNTVQNGVAFIPSTTQTYTVIGTDTNGCQGTDQVLVEVLSPTVSEINEVACVEFTLNGQSYTQSGTYIQSLSNLAGCDSTLTLNLTINELPSIPVIYSSNENILSIDAQANVTYQWIFCNSGLSINNAIDTIYSPTVNGVYGVELTNGCGTVSSECVTINNMNVPEFMNEILVYPNPSLGLVYIEGLTETSIPFKLQDVTGRAVLEGMFNASSNVLDVTRLSSGNYRILIPGYGIFSLVKQ